MKIITSQYMTVTKNNFNTTQKTIFYHLCKNVVLTKDAIITSIDNYDKILYSQLEITYFPIQFASFTLLKKLIEARNANSSPITDASKKEQSQVKFFDENEEILTILPGYLKSIIEQALENMDLLPIHGIYRLFLGWLLLIEYLSGTKNGKEKSDITAYLRQKNLVTKFSSFVFSYITESSPLITELTVDCSIYQLAAFVYKQMVSYLPSMIRQWWNEITNRSVTKEIEQYTTKYVSPGLIMAELNRVHVRNRTHVDTVNEIEYTSNLTPEDSQFTVKALRGTSNEVQATFKKDEIEVTITLSIPDSYPLKPVTVSSHRRIGVNEPTWRKWLLSMTTLLLTQDGGVLDAALLWQTNLENYFSGVELCPICYSLFHSSNFSVPNLSCKTCKSKYHGACVYKWFHTSQKNECPICKTVFN